ncbi:MAG: complex I NDUFA9 subunit family protein [Rubrivivax sp.]
MNRRVLVLGGTGFVGRTLCERVAQRGCGTRLTVPTRRLNHAREVQALPIVDPLECDVHDDAQLARAVEGHDAVVNLVAILHGNAAAFDKVHVALPRRLAAVCARAGVTRLVHVSALGVAAQAPSLYLRSKAEGEALLRAAPLQLSVLRPSVMFGDDDRFLNLFARLQRLFPVMPLAGASARFQPVWVDDVAEAIVRCLDRPNTIGQTYECAGPAVCTLAELVGLAGRLSGHERPVWPLPDWLGRWQASAMELLPGPPLMSRDNLASMRVPNVASGTLPGLQALGIEPAALQAVVPQYLSPGRGAQRFDDWRSKHDAA